MAYDLMNQGNKYAGEYSADDMEKFQGYLAQQLLKVESTLDRSEMYQELLHIYGNPVVSKENL